MRHDTSCEILPNFFHIEGRLFGTPTAPRRLIQLLKKPFPQRVLVAVIPWLPFGSKVDDCRMITGLQKLERVQRAVRFVREFVEVGSLIPAQGQRGSFGSALKCRHSRRFRTGSHAVLFRNRRRIQLLPAHSARH